MSSLKSGGIFTTQSVSCAVTTVGLNKAYDVSGAQIEVLNDVNMEVFPGEFVSIRGSSGAGKTTLLNLIGGIDSPSSGRISVFGEELTGKDEDFLADFRCNSVGFVFQAYNLVSTLTVAENVAFPMEWKRMPMRHVADRVSKLLETLGMTLRANHFPSQLSGGEQQRVAFARALANDPPLILADEPTGNLDQMNRQKLVDIFKILKAQGKTVITSTHDIHLFNLADQMFDLEGGRLIPCHD